MTGFSADWLALREPADHAARNPGLLDRLADRFHGRTDCAIIDIGAGAGSTMRALAPRLHARQHWRLIDNDPVLLGLAEHSAEALNTADRPLTVSLEERDLSSGLADALTPPPDLITASAFFDLVSAEWIERFVASLPVSQPVIYAALNYDGEEVWAPPHEADPAMLAAFHAHQRGDKGFGPAMGPVAADHLVSQLRAIGYQVHLAPSPWVLGPEHGALIRILAEGSAAAVVETGLLTRRRIEGWLAARREAHPVTIGHVDLLAIPPPAAT